MNIYKRVTIGKERGDDWLLKSIELNFDFGNVINHGLDRQWHKFVIVKLMWGLILICTSILINITRFWSARPCGCMEPVIQIFGFVVKLMKFFIG